MVSPQWQSQEMGQATGQNQGQIQGPGEITNAQKEYRRDAGKRLIVVYSLCTAQNRIYSQNARQNRFALFDVFVIYSS